MSERRSSEKMSSFSVTCCRLSQYLQEKGSLADLGLGTRPHDPPTKGVFRPPATMNLLPGVVVSADDRSDVSVLNATKSMGLFPQRAGFSPTFPADDGAVKTAATKPNKAQLTIFYGGKVLVFDNFPADKAKDLMQMAGMGSATPSASASASALVDCPPPATSGGQPARPGQSSSSDLPIARRASLHRFLEKRKDRLNSKAPYQLNASPSKPEVAQPWLGLSSESSR